MRYQPEPYCQCEQEMQAIYESHWREVDGFQNEMPFALDNGKMQKAAELGVLVVITARDEQGVLKGYALWGLGENHYHKGVLIAASMGFYVVPVARGRFVGTRLLDQSVCHLRDMGVKFVDICVKTGHDDLGHLAATQGFTLGETHFQKWIGA